MQHTTVPRASPYSKDGGAMAVTNSAPTETRFPRRPNCDTLGTPFNQRVCCAKFSSYPYGGNMYRFRHAVAFLILPFLAVIAPAQEKQTQPAKQAVTKDVDPLAMKVMSAVDQPLQAAQTYTFKALVSEEEL